MLQRLSRAASCAHEAPGARVTEKATAAPAWSSTEARCHRPSIGGGDGDGGRRNFRSCTCAPRRRPRDAAPRGDAGVAHRPGGCFPESGHPAFRKVVTRGPGPSAGPQRARHAYRPGVPAPQAAAPPRQCAGWEARSPSCSSTHSWSDSPSVRGEYGGEGIRRVRKGLRLTNRSIVGAARNRFRPLARLRRIFRVPGC